MNEDFINFIEDQYIHRYYFKVFKQGNVKLSHKIIEKGEKLGWGENGNNYWYNALIYACEGGHIDIVRSIHNYVSMECQYRLQGACEGGNMDIIEFMIEALLDHYKRYIPIYHWNGGLYGACRGGHMDIVQLMISNGANDWNMGLSGACLGGHMDIVQLMISKGADNLDWGLHSACLRGHIGIIELMISKGASDFNKALWQACDGGHLDAVQLLFSKTDNQNSKHVGIHLACLGGYDDIVNFLLKKGVLLQEMTEYSFPIRGIKTKFYHNDIYYECVKGKTFIRTTIFYWTIVYNTRYKRKQNTMVVVQKDLIPDLLKLMYF